jgi:hypothetical protein
MTDQAGSQLATALPTVSAFLAHPEPSDGSCVSLAQQQHAIREPAMAKGKSARNGKQPVSAIDLLKADHRKVEDLFEKFESTGGAMAKAKLAKEICLELSIHATIEEEIFYPALRGEVDDDKLDEAQVEHDGAKVFIAEILNAAPDDKFYDAKVKVLSEEIKHHVKEEEQRDGIFAQAKKADVDLETLGSRLEARKAELKELFKESGIPTPETRSMSGAKLKVGHPVVHAR